MSEKLPAVWILEDAIERLEVSDFTGTSIHKYGTPNYVRYIPAAALLALIEKWKTGPNLQYHHLYHQLEQLLSEYGEVKNGR